MTAAPVISAEGVHFDYVRRSGPFGRITGHTRVLHDVSLSLAKGEILGLLGESGSGKSTFGRVILGLLEPSSGSLSYNGAPLATMGKPERAAFRRKAQLIFQDPYSALNPMMNIHDAVTEPLAIQGLISAAERTEAAKALLFEVNLSPELAASYPTELSGGQRQRVVIARALSVEPDFVVADEPVASLDVSIQAQILVMLNRLRDTRSLTMLFISHDVAVVQYVSDRIAVMYRGRIVELGPAPSVISEPHHPYTQMLLASVPGGQGHQAVATGEIETEEYSGRGCVFRHRCRHARDRCGSDRPELRDIGGGHSHACMVLP